MTKIVTIDLVRAALRSEDFPKGLTIDEIRADADRYERFLRLHQLHPDRALAPTAAIDRMWHLHMLHPVAYARDCLAAFGHVLDHDGGFGADEVEAPVLEAIFAATAELWEAEYDEPYADEGVYELVNCKRNCVSRCTRRCKTAEVAL